MTLQLVKQTKLDMRKLPKTMTTNLSSDVVSIELNYAKERDAYFGKVNYCKHPNKGFIVPPVQYYLLDEHGPAITLQTTEYGTIVTKPSELIDGRYDYLRFNASLHYDASAVMDMHDVRRNLNLTYQFSLGSLNSDMVVLGDNKKVQTSFFNPGEESFDSELLPYRDYEVLGKLVIIHRKSKNAAPSSIQVGLLTATGILYRLDNNGTKTTALPIGCLSL